MSKLFEIQNLRCSYDKHYKDGISKVVLEIRELEIPKGKKIFIVGESGIGKSTILETLGLMNNTIVPEDDSIFRFYESEDNYTDLIKLWKANDDAQLSAFRKKHFNFIFQSTNLMRNFTAFENISITRMLQGYDRKSSFQRAAGVLKDLGLEHIDENRMAQELSGGQQQRLAFARAIIPDFTVLFGDEPTGNLDADNAVRAMELLSAKLDEYVGSSAIIVSHDMHLSTTFADVIIKIKKKERKSETIADESTCYGLIDEQSIFLPSKDKTCWSNGVETLETADFETYLKRG